jgi:hypothetical protein
MTIQSEVRVVLRREHAPTEAEDLFALAYLGWSYEELLARFAPT